ncbi:MAG: glycosyltransferase family 2 protein [Lachnospiraceae bacterium]|nr:glycosyltransferase family 2 protein [Lachnospiraceae bacterium]
MDTSIIILNYNDAERTASLVKTLKSYPSLDHIIVVDNCSTDGSFGILSSLKDQVTTVIRTKANRGYANGNNTGIVYALKNFSSDILFIANPDVAFEEKTLLAMIKALKENPDMGVVAPVVDQGYNFWNLPGFIGILESLFLVWFNLDKKLIRQDILSRAGDLCPVGVVEGSFFAISAKSYKAARGFDERTFLYAEEIILAKRLLEQGYSEAVLKNERYDHLHSASIKKAYSSSKAKAFPNFKKSFRIYNKYYLHTGSFQDAVFDICYELGLLERKLFDIVHHMLP